MPWTHHLNLHPQTTPDERRVLALILADTLAAIVAGQKTTDGKALNIFYHTAIDTELPDALACYAAGVARLTECDDIDLASCVTPGAVVIPVALMFSDNPDGFERAVLTGYRLGVTLGTAVGGIGALRQGIWPTLFAAPMMAAVTAATARQMGADQIKNAIYLAAMANDGRCGRPTGTPSARWLAISEAVLKGCRAARASALGFAGAPELLCSTTFHFLSGNKNLSDGLLQDIIQRPPFRTHSFKPFPVARQGANAVMALLSLMPSLPPPASWDHVEIGVPPINADIITAPMLNNNRLSKIANIAYQIALASLEPDALFDVERASEPTTATMELASKVSVVPDANLEQHLPELWPATVTVSSKTQCWTRTNLHLLTDMGDELAKSQLKSKFEKMAGEERANELMMLAEMYTSDQRQAAFNNAKAFLTRKLASPR